MAPVAVYAGSFDPITRGHQDVIARGAKLFERLIVAVGHNVDKRYAFDLDARCDMVRTVCAGLDNVEVVSFEGLLVDLVRECGADVILRGLRVLSDFDHEFRNGLANRSLAGIESMFLLSSPEHIYVSSSLIKEIAQHGGDVSPYVDPAVLSALKIRYGHADA